jgi:hypothetical protein
MNKLLAQAIQFPWGNSGSQNVNYPSQFSGFIFQGKNQSIGGILSRAIPLVFAFAGIGLLIMLLAAGFTFLTSAGDAKKMEQGKQQLTNAIIGFIIIFAAYWIVQLVGTIFGLDIIKGAFK